jgi:hypothetical protein
MSVAPAVDAVLLIESVCVGVSAWVILSFRSFLYIAQRSSCLSPSARIVALLFSGWCGNSPAGEQWQPAW